MDSSITAAGRALRAGDPLGALKRVALRDDPAALALRGIAMAQLGDLARARELLRRAAGAFGPRETLERARCLTAEAEVALAARDLARPTRTLAAAVRTFSAHGDRENEAHARLLQIRRLLLLGRIDEAERASATLDARGWARAARRHGRPARLRDRAPPRTGRPCARRAWPRAKGGGSLRHRRPVRGGRAGGPGPRPAGRAPGRRARGAVLDAGRGRGRCWRRRTLIVDGCRRAARRG